MEQLAKGGTLAKKNTNAPNPIATSPVPKNDTESRNYPSFTTNEKRKQKCWLMLQN